MGFHTHNGGIFPVLWTLSPQGQILFTALTNGDPGSGFAFASQVQGLGDGFGNLADEFGRQTASSGNSWQGEAAELMRFVGGLLQKAGKEHAGQVTQVGQAFQNLIQDYQRWSQLMTSTQQMSNTVCTHLVHLPWGCGIPAAMSLAHGTTAWSAALIALAVKTVKDVMDLLHVIDGSNFANAWTPPAQNTYTPSFS